MCQAWGEWKVHGMCMGKEDDGFIKFVVYHLFGLTGLLYPRKINKLILSTGRWMLARVWEAIRALLKAFWSRTLPAFEANRLMVNTVLHLRTVFNIIIPKHLLQCDRPTMNGLCDRLVIFNLIQPTEHTSPTSAP